MLKSLESSRIAQAKLSIPSDFSDCRAGSEKVGGRELASGALLLNKEQATGLQLGAPQHHPSEVTSRIFYTPLQSTAEVVD